MTFIICFLFSISTYSQGLIHAKGQYFMETAFLAQLEKDPGAGLSLGFGAYFGPNSSGQITLSRVGFQTLKSQAIWKTEPGGDSILFAHAVWERYRSLELQAIFARKMICIKELLSLKGLIGGSIGLEKGASRDELPVFGPLLGAETELFFSRKLALVLRYLFKYQPRSNFQTKSQFQAGLRFIIDGL